MSEADRERWDERWAARAAEARGPGEPSALLLALDPLLPRAGRALDLAGGAGRHALWLLARGLEVSVVDVSPVGLAQARAAAAAAGLASRLETRELDLERVEAGQAPFPASPQFPRGPWALILCFHFLWRPLPREAARALVPGGLLLWVQPTVRNLERHAHPSARFLLGEGEMAALAAAVPQLEVVRLDEGWSVEGRHEALLLARRVDRPGPSGQEPS